MEWLSDADVGLMLDFLYTAAEVEGPDPFPEPVVEALRLLMPADRGAGLVEVDGCDPATKDEELTLLSFSELGSSWCYDVHEPWTAELDEACMQYVERDDPIPPVPRFLNRALRFSDVLSAREYHARALYATVERPLGTEDTLRLWFTVPGETVLRRMDFGTARRGGLTDRDVLVLTLLTPHVRRLYHRAAARRTASGHLDGLTAREREILALVAEGQTNTEIARVLWISPHTVRTHLENTFEKLGVRTRSAAVARVFAPARGVEIGARAATE
jgi:DNA-binding CsgD family transcriptional regulator